MTMTSWCKPLLAATSLAIATSSMAATKISLNSDEAGELIRPEIYGQFSEHLGRGVYEGLWVGEDSSIANTRGFRNDVVSALKELQIPVLRWPGGCFADQYNWRDGIGPKEKRPKRINYMWGGVIEDNSVGTHEFFDLAEMLGTKVYLAGNMGSGTPRELAYWVEYITSDSESTLAEERRKNGRTEPWKIDYLGIGNESWGCGGNMSPDYFAGLYSQFANFVMTLDKDNKLNANRPKLVASGGQQAETIWTETLIKDIRGVLWPVVDGISHHYYTLPTDDWGVKGSATGFGEDQWISTFKYTLRIDEYLTNNIAILEEHDESGDVGIYLDEWGTWYDQEKGSVPGFLYQQNSLRDALLAAANFNIFHEHASRLHMANIAQTVNVLQAMILTDKEKMLLTPTYHAFHMYKVFQGATSIDLDINTGSYEYGDMKIAKVSATAATKDGKVYVGLVNFDPHNAETVNINLKGYSQAKGRVLTADAIDAHNTFDKPNLVKPEAFSAKLSSFKVPAKSMIVVELVK